MSRRAWVIFALYQAVAQICFWTAGLFQSQLGPWLWGTGFILLMPGLYLSGLLLPALRMAGLSLDTREVLAVLCATIINACVWLLCAKLWKLLRMHRASRMNVSGSTAADRNCSRPST
jgi:uncharacterized membrane protein